MGRVLDALCPNQYVDSLSDVSLDELRNSGADTILIDLDNTLLPWASSDVPESSRTWIAQARELGFHVCILSNTHHPARLNKIAEELGVCAVPRALKPRKAGFVKAVETSGSTPDKAIVIGDQIMTDVLGGNLAGMKTILVRPVARREFIGTKLSRLVEKVVFRILKAKGKLGTNREPSKSEKKDTR